jgi:hypothetical protein
LRPALEKGDVSNDQSVRSVVVTLKAK